MNWRCPTCKRATDSALDPDFPFCSARCGLLDLGNWADGKYAVSEPLPATGPDATSRAHDEPPVGS
ncbi:MAG: DNA gyrase inhibitor YacG [Acidobacteria bacterium]|nr:DNA gyrase inhibitor YacG [Acidobacteriota bacterium]